MSNKKIKKNPPVDGEDYKDKYLRALADYQNLEKRVTQEKEEIIAKITKNVIVKLLPFLDHLEKAEIFIKDEGLKMVKSQFLQVMTEEGIETLDLIGKEYDPQYAEAVEIVPGEHDNIIIEVVTNGYKFKDQVIRPASVRVSKKEL